MRLDPAAPRPSRAVLRLLPLVLTLALAGCAPNPRANVAQEVPLYDGLGPHRRAVTTASTAAQRYFDQGLAFLYAFNHDEARRAFRRAAELDSACAMAWWGIATANGPHINNPMVDSTRTVEACEAIARARAATGASALERELVEAAARRFALPPTPERAGLDSAYAAAMLDAWARHPADADVGALTAEALMDLHPWDLWRADGTPQPWTPAILAVLDSVLARDPQHPMANHLYIHAVEASPEPQRADASADRLRAMEPGLGHMVHMPSHIDVRRGRWAQAIEANARAMEADRRYLAHAPKPGFYRVYMAHNHHMLTYAAMMTGRSALALSTIRAMVDSIPEPWLKEHAWVADGYMAMPLEVMMRFGRWQDILDVPEYAEYLPISRAMRHYARGVAFAARGELPAAHAEERAFAAARAAVAPDAIFGNNAAGDLLALAGEVLRGEVRLREGETEAGLASLREAVRLEDRLRYDEPPDWIQPVRHALGAALLQAGHTAEAERVYREDLARLPENGWSLFGLARSLRLQKKDAEAAGIEARYKAVWKDADTPLQSSCFCQPGV